MKMNTSTNKTPKGVTLIELSVVIAVILVLISVLFIGASYYRDSANRAACVVNQSSIEKAVESYSNIENNTQLAYGDLTTSGPFAPASAGATHTRPSCPNPTGTDTTYGIDWSTGSAVVTCNGNTAHN